MKGLLGTEGILINLVSSPEICIHEWASFSTKNFSENRYVRSGDKVRIVKIDLDDKRPVEDILWTNESYQETFERAGLRLIKTYKPLAKEGEPYKWVNETRIASWTNYVLDKKEDCAGEISS